MKTLFKVLSVVIGVLCLSAVCASAVSCFLLPDSYTVMENTDLNLGNFFKITDVNTKAVSGGSGKNGAENYEANVTILGIVPVKSVNVTVTKRHNLVVCGSVIGLRIYSDGVSVIDIDEVSSGSGTVSPSFDAGIMKGDIITAVNGNKVNSADEVSKYIDSCRGNEIRFSVLRGGKNIDINVIPVKDIASEKYRVGLWLRDSAAGIGTITFFDPETNVFASLGHSVCDAETGVEVPLRRGDILSASVSSISKGDNGAAGELTGAFTDRVLGDITENSNRGVYGVLAKKPVSYGIFPLAKADEVEVGAAEVITSIDNSGPKAYSMEIVSVNTVGNEKNMIIKITDAALLASTGGIIQGMSGSPIIQNGMLVGAVTHVFLNDSTRGYAVLAENMYESVRSNAAKLDNAA